MVRFLLIFVSVFSLCGCVAFAHLRNDYGVFYPRDQMMETTCATIRSFRDNLRSSPGLRGEDSYVGYIDRGPGMSRGPSFLVLPRNQLSDNSLSGILTSFAPDRRKVWQTAQLANGTSLSDSYFEVHIPEVSRKIDEIGTIVDRSAILMIAQIQEACGTEYLVAVTANPFASPFTDRDWAVARNYHADLLENIYWPPLDGSAASSQ